MDYLLGVEGKGVSFLVGCFGVLLFLFFLLLILNHELLYRGI